MSRTLIKDATIVNEGLIEKASVLIEDEIIEGIYTSHLPEADNIVDANGRWLIPGVIDDHVHFREPGLTHKADMRTESLAAVAGGVTTVFDMPNCIPQTVSSEALENKFRMAKDSCLVNHSFYIGATRHNIDIIENLDPSRICGVKLFMGSSTGDMLLDDNDSLKSLFRATSVPVAVHCEDSTIIASNMERYTQKCNGEPPVEFHSLIRSEEACYASTSKALDIASGTRAHLHILHLTTARELDLLGKAPLEEKQFTAEACPAHLCFTDADYATMGTLIKCNPSVKTSRDRDELRKALKDGRIDVIGTDHAPHLLSEKNGGCRTAASGMPVLPYSLPFMLELTDQGILDITDVVRLMCHSPAIIFKVQKRGFIRKDYKADLVLVSHSNDAWNPGPENNHTKCAWTPFAGKCFHWKVDATWVNGHKSFHEGTFDLTFNGQPVIFQR